MNRIRLALLLVPALLLAACGGGGGGGDDSGSPAQATQLVITTGNSQAVAAEAVTVASDTDTATGSSLLTGVQVDTGGGSTMRLAGAARKLLAVLPAPVSLATGVTQSSTVACSGGGSLDVTVTTTGTGSTLAAGDAYAITANNCTEGVAPDTVRMNGTVSLTIVSGNYDPASTAYPRTVTMRIVTQNFSVADATGTTASSGDVTMTLTEDSPTDVRIALSSSSLSTVLGTHTVVLQGYSLQATETSTGSVVQVSATVETNNGRLGSGTVRYEVSTPTPITVSSSGVITAGAVKVTGNGSSLLLTVTGADTFSLQVDTNGDGGFESTTSVTRSQLQAQL